jgi:hypothetical protein
MRKKRKKEKKPEEVEKINKKEEKIEKISFSVAFSRFKKQNTKKAILMQDKEAIEMFAQKKIPSLIAPL